jgi:hypothetical protein
MGLACDPNENPEEHIGEPIPDPWSDPAQTDWPDNEELEVNEDDNSVGSDTGNEDGAGSV